MRILFTTNPGAGHWHPLVPYAEALRDAGHEVAFATAPAACDAIAALGFRHFPVGADEASGEERARLERAASLPGSEGAAWIAPDFFAGSWAARRLPDLLAVCAGWQPALIVREDMEFAGCVAAERCALPHVALQVSAWRPWLRALLVENLDRLRASAGLPPDPDLAMLERYLLLYPLPPGYQDPTAPLPPAARNVRHVAFDRSGEEQLPAWVETLPDRPVVYATMGTAFNQVAGVFGLLLAALRDEPVSLIITVGRNEDPDTFGPQPANVHIERYVPQSLLFPRCDLVVTHGGSGTVRTALAHGLPMVIVPIAADQPDNAHRCESLGVARVVGRDDRIPAAIRVAVRGVLDDPACRRKAARLRAEMERLPGPQEVVGWLQDLVLEQRPVTAVP